MLRPAVVTLACLLMLASEARADDKSGQGGGGFSELAEEEEPDPPLPKEGPKPAPTTYSQYREPDGEEQVATPEATEGDEGEALGESAAWMKRWKPRFASRRIVVDFDIWSHDSATSYMWDVVLNLGFADAPVFFDFELPFTYRVPESGKNQFHFGNITLGAHGGGVVAEIVGIYGGTTVSIPVLADDDDLEPAEQADVQARKIATLGEAALSRAVVDAYRFVPQRVPLRFMVGVELQIHPFIYFRTGFNPVFYIPTKTLQDDADLNDDDVFLAVMDQVNEIEALSPLGLGGGVRFQEAFEMTRISGNRVQLAFEPFISYEPPYEGPFAFPLVARMGMLVAIDERWGFGFDRDKVLTLRTTVGSRF